MYSLCSDGYSLVGRYTDGRRFWNNIHKFYNNSSWDTAGARPCGKSNVIMIEWSLMHSWAKYDLPMLYTQSQHGTGWNCFCCRLAIPSGNLSVHKTNTKQQKHWWLNQLPQSRWWEQLWPSTSLMTCGQGPWQYSVLWLSFTFWATRYCFIGYLLFQKDDSV